MLASKKIDDACVWTRQALCWLKFGVSTALEAASRGYQLYDHRSSEEEMKALSLSFLRADKETIEQIDHLQSEILGGSKKIGTEEKKLDNAIVERQALLTPAARHDAPSVSTQPVPTPMESPSAAATLPSPQTSKRPNPKRKRPKIRSRSSKRVLRCCWTLLDVHRRETLSQEEPNCFRK